MSKANGIIETQDGSHSLFSSLYDAAYHSHYGAIQESQHVFITAGLQYILPVLDTIRVFEMGFGTGLNALLSRLVAEKVKKRIYYETVELAPVSLSQAEQLNYPVQLGIEASFFLQLHQAFWNQQVQLSPYFQLKKLAAKLEEAEIGKDFHVVYYDAFAPTTQAELWEADVFTKIYEAMAPQSVLVTYCAKGVVKRCLRDVGFRVEGIPGPPGKREMIRAHKT
jgi:tRNA U34 5-methylaminomethyl-2-thiouridine-forming methyltransferase MnmC